MAEKSDATSNNSDWLIIYPPFCNIKNKLCIVYLLFVYDEKQIEDDSPFIV